MGLAEKIDDNLKAAMKAKDQTRLTTLRMLKSDIKYKAIEKGDVLSEEEIIGVLSTASKKRNEAIAEYQRGGREDLVSGERAELEIIKEFMPAQLSAEELNRLIVGAIDKAGAASIADLGAVMKLLMPDVRGRADGKAVNEAVREKLMNK